MLTLPHRSSGSSILKSWLDAETWMDDRLRPCKHFSLVSQSHIIFAGISTRVDKQQQHNPTCFLESNFFLQFFQLHKQQFFKYHLISFEVESKSWIALPTVQTAKRLLFAGMAFAGLIVLNILKPNGVSCPACSLRL
jgi:hypothetical protein